MQPPPAQPNTKRKINRRVRAIPATKRGSAIDIDAGNEVDIVMTDPDLDIVFAHGPVVSPMAFAPVPEERKINGEDHTKGWFGGDLYWFPSSALQPP